MAENELENPFESPAIEPSSELPPFPVGVFSSIAAVLVGACIGALWVQPEIGILLSLVVVPGLLRGYLLMRKEGTTEGANLRTVLAIFISIILMIPITLASIIGFGISCFGAAWVTIGIQQQLPVAARGDPMLGILVGLLIGLICSVLIFGLLFWSLLPGKREGKLVASGDDEVHEHQKTE